MSHLNMFDLFCFVLALIFKSVQQILDFDIILLNLNESPNFVALVVDW